MRDPFEILGVRPGASAVELRQARRKLAKELHPDLDAGRGGAAMAEVNLAYERALQSPATEEVGPADPEACFSVNVLPAEACEMLIVVGRILGEVLAADEPYRIEAYLETPEPSFCTLDLVPEAGGTIVTVTVTGADAGSMPGPHAVRDALVDELIRLTRPSTL